MTKLRDEREWLITISLMVLAFVVVSAGLAYTRGVLIPFVVALFIASIVAPVMDYQITNLRVPRPFAVAGALLAVFGIVAVMTTLMVFALHNAEDTARTSIDSMLEVFDTIETDMGAKGLEAEFEQVLSEIKNQVPSLISRSAGTALNIVSNSVLTFIFVAFLLAGRSPKIIRSGIYAEIDSKIRRYIATKLVISAITGLLVWIILTLFGLHMAPLFGILAFLLNFIPSIGSIIATMLPIPIALAQYDSPLVIVGVIALPGAVQMTIGNVIEPKLMGDGLELHPATILLALAFWGLLWGPIGMLLAVPITASGRIVLMRFETTRPFGELLAGRLPDDNQLPDKNAATSANG